MRVADDARVVVFVVIPPFLLATRFTGLGVNFNLYFGHLIFVQVFVQTFLLPFSAREKRLLG